MLAKYGKLVFGLCAVCLIVPLQGQNVIFIGDAGGGNHRSEARAVASLNGGTDLLVVGGSQSDLGFELTTFTTGDESTPPELFIHPQAFGSLPGTGFRTISDITPDGSLIVGRQYDETGEVRAFVSGPFGEDFTWMPHSPNAVLSRATGISDDGSIIVGQLNDSVEGRRAVYWDAERNLNFIPPVPGHESFVWAYDVSPDGTVIVGFAEEWDESIQVISQVGFVWTEADGIQILDSALGFTDVLTLSDDGTLGGGRIYGNEVSYPAYWSLAGRRPIVLPVPEGFEGGQVDSFSADGTVATGYLVDSDESEGPVFTGVMWDLAGHNASLSTSNHTLYLKGDGTVWATGYNLYGQLGDGTNVDKSTPFQIPGLTDVVSVTAGLRHSLFVKADGTVLAAGWNAGGQLGDGTTTDRSTLVEVVGLTDVIATATAANHSLFLKSDGTVWASGFNLNGQLGDGTTTDRSTPVQMTGITDVVAIAAGSGHSMLLKSDGTVWATGRNLNGQYGNGTTTESLVPVEVVGLSGVVSIACGGNHTYFLMEDGTVWATGLNSLGQLGDGTEIDKSSPVQVSGLSDIVAISAAPNYVHGLFLRSDRTAWSTGNNFGGQLGDGTTENKSTPVQVLDDVVEIIAGTNHSTFVKRDGSVWSTGFNGSGQFGNGSTTDALIPIRANQSTVLTFFQPWAMQYGCSFNGAHVQSASILADGETFYGEVFFPDTGAVEGYVAQIDPTPTDLTIVGRLPYPDNRTQDGVGDSVFIRDIDPLGRLAAGQGNFHEGAKSISLPVYWTPGTGLREFARMTDNPNPDEWSGRFGRVYDVTTCGDFMVGQGFGAETWGYGFMANAQGETARLPVNEIFSPIEGQIIREESRAFAMSDGGNIIVGQANARGRSTPNRGARWDQLGEGQLLSIEGVDSALLSFATDISVNGSVVNGFALLSDAISPTGFVWRPIVWEGDSPRVMPLLEGYTNADTWFMSHDGATVVGSFYNLNEQNQPAGRQGYLWNLADDSFDMLDLPGGWTEPDLLKPNFDGSIVTGIARDGEATLTFVWDRNRGVYEVKDYLETVLGYTVGPYEITLANPNDEGTHLVGQVAGKYGEFAFFMPLPEELVPAGARYLWRSAPAREDAYKNIDWFGWLADSGTYPWVYHIEHGWIYTQGSDPKSFALFDTSLDSWWLIDRNAYPWMFKLGANSGWYYYYAPFGTPGERFFYNPATGETGLEADIFPN
ncbi:MAG: hypothetical protein AB3N64_13785 [Puniceicoccaceae bacterium]